MVFLLDMRRKLLGKERCGLTVQFFCYFLTAINVLIKNSDS